MTRQNLSIDYLQEWLRSGAQWRVAEISNTRAVVELCTCYGEPVDRLETSALEVIHYLCTAGVDARAD